jgi:stage V sporulation protein AC
VLGVGAKLFTVAGPVLAYGLGSAFLVGVVRLLVGS